MSKLIESFYENANNTPDKLALWCDGQSLTYGELAKRVNQCSHFLISCGICYGEHIGFPMNNSVESVVLMLSAANLGLAIVPISPTLPLEAIYKAFETGKVQHIIARSSFYAQCEKRGGLDVTGVRICQDDVLPDMFSFQNIESQPDFRPQLYRPTGDETYILTMTSGSTGDPKPIELTQNNKYARSIKHIELYGLTPEDRVLAATPLYHTLAERLVLLPLILGGTSILLPRFTPILWLNCIKDQKVTFTIAVSAQLAQVAELLSSPFAPEIDSLRCLVSSSALLEPHVKSALIEKLHCEFHEMYGTSETSTVTDIDFNIAKEKRKSVGTPLPGASIRIMLDDGTKAQTGEIGEILCKTELLCNSYYGMPEKFQSAQIDGYFKTGDLGYLDEDGYLYFSGRKKELIITGAVNVYPQDIEEVVNRIPQVDECAAFAYPDDRLGEIVALAVVLKAGEKVSKRDIQRQCAKHLADYQQPQKVLFMEKLPKNAMGKLTKHRLLEYARIVENEEK